MLQDGPSPKQLKNGVQSSTLPISGISLPYSMIKLYSLTEAVTLRLATCRYCIYVYVEVSVPKLSIATGHAMQIYNCKFVAKTCCYA